jgi:SPOR domain
VSQVSHDPAEDGFHEIQLSGKQLVFLFMLATIVLSFTFLVGVLLGRGARDVREADALTTTSAPTSDAPPQPLAGSGPPAAEPPAPAESPDELSYHNRLQGAGAPAEDLRKASPTPQATPAAPPAAPRAAAPSDVPTSGRPGTHVIQVFVSRDRNAAVALVKKLGGSGYPAFLVVPESPSVPQMYKVQVGRYSEREAEKVARQLEKEGDFKPWVTSSR